MSVEQRLSELEKCCHKFNEFMQANFAYRVDALREYPKEYEWLREVESWLMEPRARWLRNEEHISRENHENKESRRIMEDWLNGKCSTTKNPKLAKELFTTMNSRLQAAQETHEAWAWALDAKFSAHATGIAYVDGILRSKAVPDGPVAPGRDTKALPGGPALDVSAHAAPGRDTKALRGGPALGVSPLPLSEVDSVEPVFPVWPVPELPLPEVSELPLPSRPGGTRKYKKRFRSTKRL